MANYVTHSSEKVIIESREALVDALEQGFAKQVESKDLGQAMLHGVAWHALDGDKAVYPEMPLEAGSMFFIQDKLAALALTTPEHRGVYKGFLELTKTNADKRRYVAAVSGRMHLNQSCNDEEFARRVLKGEFTFPK